MWSRLSREGSFEGLSILSDLFAANITLVTTNDGKPWRPEDRNKPEMVLALLGFSQSHTAVAETIRLIRGAWSRRKANADVVSAMAPAWLEVTRNAKGESIGYVVNEQRAEVVRMIFEWARSDMGVSLIAKQLDELGHKAFGKSLTTRRIKTAEQPAKKWNRGSVASLLKNRSVIGEYKPGKRIGKKEIVDDDIPTRLIFPRVIEDDVFYEVQTALSGRSHQGGRKGNNIANIFSHGLLRCAYCDSTVIYENKNYRNAKRRLGTYLVCSDPGCERTRWRYDDFETSFLNYIGGEIDIDKLSLKDTTDPRIETDRAIASLQGELTHARSRYEQTTETMLHVTNKKILGQKLNTIQADIDRLEAAIEAKEARKEYESSREEIQSLVEALQQKELNEDTFALRQKLVSRMRSLIDGMYMASVGSGERFPFGPEVRTFLPSRYFTVNFKNGASMTVAPDTDEYTHTE
jgi:hypothetical protein